MRCVLRVVGLGLVLLGAWATAAGAQLTPVARTLQAQATEVGQGSVVKTSGLHHKTVAIEIAGAGVIHVECSIDNGVSFDTIEDTTFSEQTVPACGSPPNRCLIDLPVSCTDMRAPITTCTDCSITAKIFAEP